MLDANHARDEAVADLPGWTLEAFSDRQLADLPLRALWKLSLRMFRPPQRRDWSTVQHVAFVLETYLGTVTLDGTPSQRRLAEDSGRRPDTVRRALEQLEVWGWLEIARGQEDRKGRPAAHRYTATFPEELRAVPGAWGVRLEVPPVGLVEAPPTPGTVGPPEDPPTRGDQPTDALLEDEPVGLREDPLVGPTDALLEDEPVGLREDPLVGPPGASGGSSPGTLVGPREAPEVATRSVLEKLPENMPARSLRSPVQAAS